MRELCRFYNSRDFNELLKATKDFVSKNEARPIWTTIFLRGKQNAGQPLSNGSFLYHDALTAIAIDGYRISREICRNVSITENFTGYIYVPRVKPTTGESVAIYQDDDETIVIAYETANGGIQIRNRQPKSNAPTHEELYNQASDFATDTRMGVNATYLENAAMSLTSGKQLPIIMSTSLDPTKPVKLQKGDSVRIVLPVRIRNSKD